MIVRSLVISGPLCAPNNPATKVKLTSISSPPEFMTFEVKTTYSIGLWQTIQDRKYEFGVSIWIVWKEDTHCVD